MRKLLALLSVLFVSFNSYSSTWDWVAGPGFWSNGCINSWLVDGVAGDCLGPSVSGQDVLVTHYGSYNTVVYNAIYPNVTHNLVVIDGDYMDFQQDYVALSLNSTTEIVGDYAAGLHSHGLGGNNITNLTLGNRSSSTGTYELFGSATLTSNVQTVGGSGTGIFAHSASTNVVNDTIYIGKESSATGTYNLFGSGSLTVTNSVLLGDKGTGTFNHSAGTSSIGGNLELGRIYSWYTTTFGNRYTYRADGYYNLSGNASLDVAGTTQVGIAGNGYFNQSGGNHTTSGLTLGAARYSSGYLAGARGYGEYNLSSGALVVSGEAIVGLNGSGNFDHSGGIHTVNTVTIGAGLYSSGLYSLYGTGTLQAGAITVRSGQMDHSAGVNTVSGAISLGKISGRTATYNLSDTGVVTSNRLEIGDNGVGIFDQVGGTNNTQDLILAQGGETGYYRLASGTLNTNNTAVIGAYGSANFDQQGGVHNIFGNLTLAQNSSSSGSYVLSGGELNVDGNIVNGLGIGNLNISGGVLKLDNGMQNINVSSLALSGTGLIEVANNSNVTIENSVDHQGQSVSIFTGSNVVFNGVVTGGSDYTGNGTVRFNNLLVQSDSSGQLTVEGDMILGENAIFSLDFGLIAALDVGNILFLDGELNGTFTEDVNNDGFIGLGGPLGDDLFLGDTFDVITAEHLIGTFDLLTLGTIGDGLGWQVDYLFDEIGTTDIVRLTVVQAVPIPTAAWLFFSALGCLLSFRKINSKE